MKDGQMLAYHGPISVPRGEGLTSMIRRSELLNPNRGADIQVEMYQVSLGTVKAGDGPITVLSTNPSCVFRPIRIHVTAHIQIKYPFWMRALARIKVPLVKIDLEPGEWGWRELLEWDRYEVYSRRPFIGLKDDRYIREQHRALQGCTLTTLKVANTECLLPGLSISLEMLCYGITPLLDMPTVPPQYTITAEFKGTAQCTFSVSMTGWAAQSRSDVVKDPQPDLSEEGTDADETVAYRTPK